MLFRKLVIVIVRIQHLYLKYIVIWTLSWWFCSLVAISKQQHDSELATKTLAVMYATYEALEKLHTLRSLTIQYRLFFAKFLPTVLLGSELTAFGVNIKQCAVLYHHLRTMLEIRLSTNKSVILLEASCLPFEAHASERALHFFFKSLSMAVNRPDSLQCCCISSTAENGWP